MCRFACYLGTPILMDELVIRSEHSLLSQSTAAQETLFTFNGDGFGIGWYDHRIDEEPAIFTSIQPAWNDLNLINVTKKILTECFFAHVRAATVGGASVHNCHPFHYQKFLFMHNGKIANFSKIKRALRRELSDETYAWLRGETDSEHFSALFAHLHALHQREESCDDYVVTLAETIAHITRLQIEHDCVGLNLLNIAITDGRRLIVSRYSSQPEQDTNTLYYSGHSEVLSGNARSVVVASERLTLKHAQWHEVPVNHVFVADDTHDKIICRTMPLV